MAYGNEMRGVGLGTNPSPRAKIDAFTNPIILDY